MVKSIIKSKNGETLVESVISLLIFSFLLLTITLTIQTALRITSISTQAAYRAQNEINEIVAGFYPTPSSGTITFSFEAGAGVGVPGEASDASHNVIINNVPGQRAFRPASP